MLPTIEGHHYEGGQLVLETIDSREDTNLISTDEGLVRYGETLTEEQQEKLALRERQ